MNKRETTRTAFRGRTSKFAVLAVALLCAVALSAVLADSDNESDGAGATTTEKCEVKVTVTHGTGDTKEITKGSNITITVRSATGYMLPVDSAVTKSNVQGTCSGFAYHTNTARTSADITFTGVTTDVSLAITSIQVYTVKVTIEHGNDKTVLVEHGKDASFTITSSSGYALPLKSSIKTSDLTGTTTIPDYTLNSTHTSADVKFSAVKGNITMKVTCVKMVAVDKVVVKDGVSTPSHVTTGIAPGLEVKGQFDAIRGYNLPATITVKNGDTPVPSTDYVYDKTTGKFTLKAAAIHGDKVVVTGVYTNCEYTFTSSVINGAVKETDLKPMFNKSLTITLVPNAHFEFPDPKDVSVTNGDKSDFTYDATTGVITIKLVEGNVKVSAKCAPETYTVTYYDSDGKTKLDMSPDRFSYGVGCVLPTDVKKQDYIFVCWNDSNGNKVTGISKDWAPAEGAAGNFDVYAHFVDDLTKYDTMDYQLPYIIVAILALIGAVVIPVIMRVRK